LFVELNVTVFHQKLRKCDVGAINGDRLSVDFDQAEQKRVLDSFCDGGSSRDGTGPYRLPL